MKRTRTLAALMVAAILVLLLVACGGGDDDTATSSSGDTTTEATNTSQPPSTEAATEQTATSQPDEPTATTTDDEPTATAEDTVATAATTAEPAGNRLVGSATVDDDEDDVVNLLMQEPDEPMPGIDLVSVSLEGDGSQMLVTIQTAGDIEAELTDDADVSFDVHLWQDDKPAYALSFHHDGSDAWEATVTDFSVGILGDEEAVDTDISVAGNTLSGSFPVSMLPDLEDSFEWYSSVMWSDGGMPLNPDAWFDGAPENVIQLLADPEKFVAFPQ